MDADHRDIVNKLISDIGEEKDKNIGIVTVKTVEDKSDFNIEENFQLVDGKDKLGVIREIYDDSCEPLEYSELIEIPMNVERIADAKKNNMLDANKGRVKKKRKTIVKEGSKDTEK